MTLVKCEITVIGLGVREFLEVSKTGLDLFQEADKIVYLGQSKFAQSELMKFDAQFIDLSEFYVDGNADDVYDNIVDVVIKASFDSKKLVFATNGNPTFLNNITKKLAFETSKLGGHFNVIQAQSSLDIIMGLCHICPKESPIFVTTEHYIVEKSPVLDKNFTTIIFQLGTASDGQLLQSKGSMSDNFKKLLTHVQKYLPPHQKWEFVSLASEPFDEDLFVTGDVAQLSGISKINQSGTLILRPFDHG